jgi:hypothetical protein
LFFSPPLENLHLYSGPIHLRLSEKIPVVAPPLEAFSKHAPIGTGRPCSSILLAESDRRCKTAEAARASLAYNILKNNVFVVDMLDRYNVLTTLYTSSTDTLLSLYRGMVEMLGVSELEWLGRQEQLHGQVDGACILEARMEVFLLGVGRLETEEWVGIVEFVMDMEEKDRSVWAEVYGDAAAFLRQVVWEMNSD